MKIPVRCVLLWALAAIGACVGPAQAFAETAEAVAVVACPSDGQLGPTPPAVGGAGTPTLPVSAARRLAYYVTAEMAVLAPRGWNCFGLSGSSGSSIVVTPEPYSPDEAMRGRLRIGGPGVQLSLSLAGTSGRFKVAEVIARLFPDKVGFVQAVIDERIVPASRFPLGPYPHDRVERRSPLEVEFETPANADGMGTRSFLVKGRLPVQGVAILAEGDEPDLLQLFVRLPDDMRALGPILVDEVRRR
jgi:hypothetical protein